MKEKTIFNLFIILFAIFPLYVHADNETNKNTVSNRTLLKIPYEDREDLLRVMRKNLENLGKMIDAMADNDFDSVKTIAENMSFNKKKGKGLSRRGNSTFTAMGVQFHAINTIEVMKAAETKDRKVTLHSMSKMVKTCIACHSTFRVMEWPDNKTYKRPKSTKLILPKGYRITH